MKLFLPVSLAIALIGCASMPNTGPSYTFDEIRVVNNSSTLIRDLSVSATGSGVIIDCGDIVALGLCSERVGRRSYAQEPFEINWSFGDSARRSDRVEIQVPAYNAPGNPLYAVFEINPAGQLSAELVQKIPP